MRKHLGFLVAVLLFSGNLLLIFGTTVFAKTLAYQVESIPNYTVGNTRNNNSSQAPDPTNICVGNACQLDNPFTFKTVPQFIDKILDIVIKIGFVLAVFFMIYAGFLFVTASGSVDKITKAKATFLWTVVGIALVLGAKVIQQILTQTVGDIVR